MKAWVKETGDETRFYDRAMAASVVMIVISVVVDRFILFVPAAMLLLLVGMGKIYDRYSGKKLFFHHEKKTIRLFPGESTSLKLQIENGSRFPMLNGRLSFHTGNSVKNMERQTIDKEDYHYKLPLTLHGKGAAYLNLPLEAVHRGTTKVKHVSFTYPHIITFIPVRLTYQKPVHTEFLVYPELVPIMGVDEYFHRRSGAHHAPESIVEDPSSPAGVRDYISGDSIKRIHWKASAKAQTLKTKILEKQMNKEMTIFINLTQHSRLGHAYRSGQLERLLSAAGSFCMKAAHFEVPYELFVNVKRPHQASIFKQESGEGALHVKHSLELLARVDKSFPVQEMSPVMYKWDQQTEKQNTVVIVGDVDGEMKDILHEWQWKGRNILILETEKDAAFLYAWKRRR
ncbi:DUF58 domain-containing protein [Halobacillus sp. Cin3]|uniref:DUF58 domain-containing protein n=1 Tax=Halobacillus sp. Cin3 TaxID=2928441 RepID=UPI00248E3E11|nr:DUF58 domain-containing protein [Halobacillus sp. Cin3]